MPNPLPLLLSAMRRGVGWLRRAPLGWLIVLIGGELVLAQRQLYGPLGFDESYFMWEGWAVNHHLVPYRDFIEFKPPVVFWVNGLAQRLFGLADFRFRLLFVWLLVASTVLLFLVLWRRGGHRPVAFLAAASIGYALLAPHLHDASLDDAETIGMIFYVFGLALLLWKGRGLDATTAIGGGAFALSVLSKEPYAFAVLATWMTIGFVFRDEGIRSWSRYARLTILGAAAVAVPILLYLGATGAIPLYLQQMHIYFSYADQIGCAKPHSIVQLWDQAWPRLETKLLIPEMYASAIPLFVAFAVLPGWGFLVRIGLVLAVLGSFFSVTVGGCYFAHYFVMGMAGLALWVALGALSLSRWLAGANPDLRRWVSWTLIAGAFMHMAPLVALDVESHFYQSRNTSVAVPSQIIDFVRQNSGPHDRVLTDGGPELYVLARRLPTLREICLLDELIDMRAGRTDEERLASLRAELRARPPKVVYLSPEFAARKVRTRRALILPFLQEEHYRRISDELYVRP